jgi:hypothetical protein
MKRTVRAVLILALVGAVTIRPPLFAQTSAKGPWWPHPIWGPDDQAGGSNWITPEKVLEAVRLVKTGKVYELGSSSVEAAGSGGGKRRYLSSPVRTPPLPEVVRHARCSAWEYG